MLRATCWHLSFVQALTRTAVFVLASSLCTPLAAWAEAANEPWLRIETGSHTAKTNAASTDAAGTVLATGSEDKTVRIWSLPDLHPLAVLRPPGGPDELGQVYAVAVSPDADVVAVGGWLGTGGYDILVFDLRRRRVILRIGGLPNVANALAISPDGQHLAAGLAGRHGIRIWRLPSGESLARDEDYEASVQGVAFARDGRLAAAALDGSIRLYAAQGQRLARVPAVAGRQPGQVRFDPDGGRLAVGFHDTPGIEVRDGRSLALQATPVVPGTQGGGLSAVGWSGDGATVLAGGDARLGRDRPVLAWADAGRKRGRIAAPGPGGGISAILPLQDGLLVVTSRTGGIEVVDAHAGRLTERHQGSGDLRTAAALEGPSRRLPLSSDGTVVEWAFADAPDRWLRFDARKPDLAAVAEPGPGLKDWSDQAGASRVTGWNQGAAPAVNGRPVALDPGELARSVAVTSNRVLLGASWSLRLLDADGLQLWRTSVPAAAWRVNLSRDGRLAAAALGDGTIRWYRAADGRELLALFVAPDARHWVAFTPSGYYAAAPGSEDLIGWQVNNGDDAAADFFPASRFRERFYRSDVVALVLDTFDEAEAVRRADEAQAPRQAAVRPSPPVPAAGQEILDRRPPVVTISAPQDGAQVADDAAVLDVEVRSPTGRPVTRVETRVDGRPVSGTKATPSSPATPSATGPARWRLTVPLPSGVEDAALQVIAFTGDLASEPAVLRVRRPAQADVPMRPRLIALLVGISEYRSKDMRLKFAADDAAELARALKRQEGAGGLYREVEVRNLPPGEATRDAIMAGLLWLKNETTQADVAVLFLAGHGSSPHGEYFFLPVDASLDEDDIELHGLSGADIRRILGQIAGKAVALLDTCYAGALAETSKSFRGPPPDLNKFVSELTAAESGVAVYAATTGRQRAVEDDALRHGVFTHSLLDILNGAAVGAPTAELRVYKLAELLAQNVQKLTFGRQASTYNALTSLRNFPLFMVMR